MEKVEDDILDYNFTFLCSFLNLKLLLHFQNMIYMTGFVADDDG